MAGPHFHYFSYFTYSYFLPLGTSPSLTHKLPKSFSQSRTVRPGVFRVPHVRLLNLGLAVKPRVPHPFLFKGADFPQRLVS
jgi:hypothetical protein